MGSGSERSYTRYAHRAFHTSAHDICTYSLVCQQDEHKQTKLFPPFSSLASTHKSHANILISSTLEM